MEVPDGFLCFGNNMDEGERQSKKLGMDRGNKPRSQEFEREPVMRKGPSSGPLDRACGWVGGVCRGSLAWFFRSWEVVDGRLGV